MYVCMYVCMQIQFLQDGGRHHVCITSHQIYADMRAHVCVCSYVCMYTCIQTCVHARMYACVYINTRSDTHGSQKNERKLQASQRRDMRYMRTNTPVQHVRVHGHQLVSYTQNVPRQHQKVITRTDLFNVCELINPVFICFQHTFKLLRFLFSHDEAFLQLFDRLRGLALVCMFLYTSRACTRAYIHTCTYRMCSCVCTYTYRVCISVCTYTYILSFLMGVYTYIHTYMHAYIHIECALVCVYIHAPRVCSSSLVQIYVFIHIPDVYT